MPRFNGDIRLDGKLIFPSGAEDTMAIRATANGSATGEPASGQIRFFREGNQEGYWYLQNHPSANLYDFDAGCLPSGQRIATLEDAAPAPISSLIIALSDESTAIEASASGVMSFRMPIATLTSSPLGVRASVNSATTSGTVTIDVNVNGSTILDTKLTIDATETTSVTAAVQASILTAAIADDDLLSVDIDDMGDGTATGLKLTLIYEEGLSTAFFVNPFMTCPVASSGTFSPSDISNLRVWFDAQDDDQITVVDTDKCNVWASKEGDVSISMVPPAGNSNKPIIEDINGKQMLQFSSARFLSSSASVTTTLSPGTGPMTVISVTRTTATARSSTLYLANGTSIIQSRLNNVVGDGNFVGQFRDSEVSIQRLLINDTDVDRGDGTVRIDLMERPGSMAAGGLWTNNVASSTNPITDTSDDIDANYGNLYMGRDGGGGANPLVGHIGEVLIYFGVLTTQEKSDLNTYLVAKWSL